MRLGGSNMCMGYADFHVHSCKSDGVLTEEELIESKKDRIDPRLAKLKEFKIED